MPTISTTTLEDLEPLMVALIVAIVPRVRTQQTSTWKHYPKGQVSPGRTRSFTLRWGPGPANKDGYYTSADNEQNVTLRVRTDYAGQHETLQWLVQDDNAALRDTLNILTADKSTGLVKLLEGDSAPSLVADTGQGRQGISDRPVFNSDTFQIDFTFAVTFMQARIAA